MEPRNSMRKAQPPHQHSTRRARNLSKRWWALSYTIPKPSTVWCSQPSDLLQPKRKIRPKIPWKKWDNSWTMRQVTPMPSSHTNQATWYLPHTATPLTDPKEMQEAKQEGIFSCPMIIHTPQQRSRTRHHPNYQGGHIFRHGSRNRSSLYQLTRSHPHPPHTRRNRTSTTPYVHINW